MARSIYRSTSSREQLFACYDRMLEDWPVPFKTSFVQTSFGVTHVLCSGDEHASPVVLLHPGRSNSVLWRRNVAELSRALPPVCHRHHRRCGQERARRGASLRLRQALAPADPRFALSRQGRRGRAFARRPDCRQPGGLRAQQGRQARPGLVESQRLDADPAAAQKRAARALLSHGRQRPIALRAARPDARARGRAARLPGARCSGGPTSRRTRSTTPRGSARRRPLRRRCCCSASARPLSTPWPRPVSAGGCCRTSPSRRSPKSGT